MRTIFVRFIRILKVNIEDTCTRHEKYYRKLYIFHSFIRIFANQK